MCSRNNKFNGNNKGRTLYNFRTAINPQTGVAYTIQASDLGKTITLDNAAAITVTIPKDLGQGFNCLLVQIGAGQVTVVGPDVTIRNRSAHTKIAGQWGVASILAFTANNFIFQGDTA